MEDLAHSLCSVSAQGSPSGHTQAPLGVTGPIRKADVVFLLKRQPE